MSEKTFEIYPEIKSEKVYFNNRFGIKIAGDLYLPADYENQKNPAIHGLEGWIACYPKSRLAGKVFAGGVNDAGAIKGHKALQEAYAMGRGIL